MQCLSAADAAIQPFKPYLVSSLPDNLSSKAFLPRLVYSAEYVEC